MTFGAIQSLNSISSTFRPCLSASATAASRGIAKAAVVPTFSGASAAWIAVVNRPSVRASTFTNIGGAPIDFAVFGMQSDAAFGSCYERRS
ncbi:hypothetical protein D9M73_234880 [compost metagenome]